MVTDNISFFTCLDTYITWLFALSTLFSFFLLLLTKAMPFRLQYLIYVLTPVFLNLLATICEASATPKPSRFPRSLDRLIMFSDNEPTVRSVLITTTKHNLQSVNIDSNYPYATQFWILSALFTLVMSALGLNCYCFRNVYANFIVACCQRIRGNPVNSVRVLLEVGTEDGTINRLHVFGNRETFRVNFAREMISDEEIIAFSAPQINQVPSYQGE